LVKRIGLRNQFMTNLQDLLLVTFLTKVLEKDWMIFLKTIN
jgi:hypothetical protein